MFTNQIFIWIEVKAESRFHQLDIHVTKPQIVLLPGRHKLNVSKVLRINKPKEIMPGGIRTNIDSGGGGGG